MALAEIQAAKDPGHRSLLILGVRAFKMVDGLEKLAAADEQRAATAFETKFLPQLRMLEAEVSAAEKTSKVPVAELHNLSTCLETLRAARLRAVRAAGASLPQDVADKEALDREALD